MNLGNRKLWTIAAPLALGIGLLAVFGGMNAFRSGSKSKTGSKTADSSAVPENPAHERAALEEQLKVNPNHTPILFRLAEMERDAGRPAGAVPYLRKILAQDATNLDARLELSRMLYESGDTDGALTETKQLLIDHPHQVDGLYNLGAIYANQRRADLARQYWTEAVATSPDSESGRRAKDGLAQLGK